MYPAPWTLGNYKQVLASVSVFNQAATWMLILPVAVFAIAGMIEQYKFTAWGPAAANAGVNRNQNAHRRSG